MAIGKKTGGRNIKPGTTLNPAGRPSHDADVKAIRDSLRKDIYFWCDSLFNLPNEDLNARLKNDKTLPALARGIIKSIQKFRLTGNWKYVEYPIDQIIGKPKQSVDVAGGFTGNVTIEIVPGKDAPQS